MARLTKTDWLDHALATLSAQGFTALKADTLAQSLGVSRGSFYWHFEDLAAFHGAVLERWLQVSVVAVVDRLDQQDLDPEAKLRALVETAANGDRAMEQAMRSWAFSDPTVAPLVADVDRQRVAYITSILRALGFDAEQAGKRALVLYLTSVGHFATSLVTGRGETELVEELLARTLAPAAA